MSCGVSTPAGATGPEDSKDVTTTRHVIGLFESKGDGSDAHAKGSATMAATAGTALSTKPLLSTERMHGCATVVQFGGLAAVDVDAGPFQYLQSRPASKSCLKGTVPPHLLSDVETNVRERELARLEASAAKDKLRGKRVEQHNGPTPVRGGAPRKMATFSTRPPGSRPAPPSLPGGGSICSTSAAEGGGGSAVRQPINQAVGGGSIGSAASCPSDEGSSSNQEGGQRSNRQLSWQCSQGFDAGPANEAASPTPPGTARNPQRTPVRRAAKHKINRSPSSPSLLTAALRASLHSQPGTPASSQPASPSGRNLLLRPSTANAPLSAQRPQPRQGGLPPPAQPPPSVRDFLSIASTLGSPSKADLHAGTLANGSLITAATGARNVLQPCRSSVSAWEQIPGSLTEINGFLETPRQPMAMEPVLQPVVSAAAGGLSESDYVPQFILRHRSLATPGTALGGKACSPISLQEADYASGASMAAVPYQLQQKRGNACATSSRSRRGMPAGSGTTGGTDDSVVPGQMPSSHFSFACSEPAAKATQQPLLNHRQDLVLPNIR